MDDTDDDAYSNDSDSTHPQTDVDDEELSAMSSLGSDSGSQRGDDDTTTTALMRGDDDDSGGHYYFVDEPESMISSVNSATTKRVVFVGMALFAFVSVIIGALFLFWIIPNSQPYTVKPPYLHDNLEIAIADSNCMYGIQQPTEPPTVPCTPAQNDLTGCQVGCGLVDANKCSTCQCGLTVTVSWKAINVTAEPQWIYLLASTSGLSYWQTGFAQPVLQQQIDPDTGLASGTADIKDGCFSQPYQVVNIVACLSSRKLKNLVFSNFPVNHCNVTKGLCIATNNVALRGPSPACQGNDWIGNSYIDTWPANQRTNDATRATSSSLLLLSLCMLLVVVLLDDHVTLVSDVVSSAAAAILSPSTS